MKTWETSLKCCSKQVGENEKHVCKKKCKVIVKSLTSVLSKQSWKRCQNIGK